MFALSKNSWRYLLSTQALPNIATSFEKIREKVQKRYELMYVELIVCTEFLHPMVLHLPSSHMIICIMVKKRKEK